MSSVGRIRIDDCSHDRTLLVELTIILLRMSNLQGHCQQRPSNGLTTSIVSSCETRLAIDRFQGFRFASPQVIIPARFLREIFAPAMFDELPES